MENIYIQFYYKPELHDFFESGWKTNASPMQAISIEFSKEVIGDLHTVTVNVDRGIPNTISEIAVFKDEVNSNSEKEIWVINIYNERGDQIVHVVGAKSQIEKFLDEFNRNVESGNVLNHLLEEKYKEMERLYRELEDSAKTIEEKKDGETGYEPWYGEPTRFYKNLFKGEIRWI